MNRFLCNSPLYDPAKEPHKANHAMFYKSKYVDRELHEWKDEGVYPEALGTYHMYHRIDGKLVAFTVIDICTRFMNSAYCVYDPDYKFLSLGVVSAIREIEFMRLIKRKFNPDLTFYQLGDMVVTCPKVNYKMNYSPGIVICPRTKKDMYWDQVKEKAMHYAGLTSAEKAELPSL